MTPLLGTLALVAFICIPLWLLVRWDERTKARAKHPSNWSPESFDDHSQAIDLTRDVDVLMDDIESYLKNREPRR